MDVTTTGVTNNAYGPTMNMGIAGAGTTTTAQKGRGGAGAGAGAKAGAHAGARASCGGAAAPPSAASHGLGGPIWRRLQYADRGSSGAERASEARA